MSNPESEPAITLNFNDGEILLPRSRTSLWTFLGRSALDHVFLEQEQQEEGKRLGSYLFRDRVGDEAFNTIHAAAREYLFEMHENLPNVSESDMESYISSNSRDIEESNTIPDDWV